MGSNLRARKGCLGTESTDTCIFARPKIEESGFRLYLMKQGEITMSKSAHMGKERGYLERISELKAQKKLIENQQLAILDRLTNDSPAYSQLKLLSKEIDNKIQRLREKVEYHVRSQMKHNKIE